MTIVKSSRQQEFRDKINVLAKTIHEYKGTPTNQQEKIKYVERSLHVLVIEALKEFADRNFEGKKPEWIVSSANIIPNTDMPQDRIYLARNEPKNHQVMLDTLKKYGIVPEDSQIKDYDFLFSFEKNKKK